MMTTIVLADDHHIVRQGLRALLEVESDLKVIGEAGDVLEAMSNGASAYVLKDSSSADLVQAVREAAAGRHYLSPPLSDRAIEAYQEKAKAANLDRYETLTSREREVLHLAAEGRTNNEIATRLGISSRTAETHRSNLMHKLDLHTQADLIRFALRRGIIPMEE